MSFFGQPQQQPSAFGGQSQPAGGLFGQQNPGFGQQQQQPVQGFGMQQQQPQIDLSQCTDQQDVPVQCQLSDAVSCLKFSPAPMQGSPYMAIGFRMLAATTWDGNLLIFQVNHQDNGQTSQAVPAQVNQVVQQQVVQCPILGMCWQVDAAAVLLACADNMIRKFDVQSQQTVVIGQHTQPVKDVVSILVNGNQSVVISGGWDCRVKFWSWQSPQQLNMVGESYVAMPVHYMSCKWPLLVTAHQDRFIHVWELPTNFQTNNWNPKEVTESPLKFATTSISVFGDGTGYAVGSIEGRCGIKYHDISKQDLRRSDDFCFKCHREEVKGGNKADVYAVNGITFNEKYNTFATYGSDGVIVIWNKDTKSKYKTSKKFPRAFTSADFSEDGKLLAYAIGYDWAKGFEEQRNQPRVQHIFIRSPKIDEEVYKPRR